MNGSGHHWRGADEVPRSAESPDSRAAEARAGRDAAFARLAEAEQRLAETKRRAARWELVDSVAGCWGALWALLWAILKLLGLVVVLRIFWDF